MKIRILAAGTRMPSWVNDGYAEYARRLPRECSLGLVEIALGQRGKSQQAEKAMAEEGKRMLAALPKDTRVIAMDVQGKSWSTRQLVTQMQDWMQSGRNTSLLIGGPDGLDPSCLQRASQRWSLSALTLPHPLVRVVLAEQLYRAWTVVAGHPYHRS